MVWHGGCDWYSQNRSPTFILYHEHSGYCHMGILWSLCYQQWYLWGKLQTLIKLWFALEILMWSFLVLTRNERLISLSSRASKSSRNTWVFAVYWIWDLPAYMWCNNKLGRCRFWVRLDRMQWLIVPTFFFWCTWFSSCMNWSDHCPNVLHYAEASMKIFLFKFEKFWLRWPDIGEIMARSWSKFTSSLQFFASRRRFSG